MLKVICIDDEPKRIIDTSKRESLEQILRQIYKHTYEVIFAFSGEEGVVMVQADKSIRLVLLDIEFKGHKKQGDVIAKDLIKARPDLKVIVLTKETATGTKISLGHKKNVVHYIIKNDLALSILKDKLRNLSKAIVDDFNNSKWHMEYEGNGTIKLSNKKGYSYGINVPSMCEEAVLSCMRRPNEPVSIPSGLSNADLNKVHNKVNNNVREGTEWNTWGLLTKEGCAKGQLKLMIGSVAPVTVTDISKDPYVTHSQFDKLKNDFELFKKDITAKLADAINNHK